MLVNKWRHLAFQGIFQTGTIDNRGFLTLNGSRTGPSGSGTISHPPSSPGLRRPLRKRLLCHPTPDIAGRLFPYRHRCRCARCSTRSPKNSISTDLFRLEDPMLMLTAFSIFAFPDWIAARGRFWLQLPFEYTPHICRFGNPNQEPMDTACSNCRTRMI